MCLSHAEVHRQSVALPRRGSAVRSRGGRVDAGSAGSGEGPRPAGPAPDDGPSPSLMPCSVLRAAARPRQAHVERMAASWSRVHSGSRPPVVSWAAR
ncbi:hypothetical protein [Kitasatospora sp. NPDC058046]|uniref:hypothetical protein n=1 Tax=Kitasatospora sp. NPDC058046 TaxID=3346312 RepID=UPI0036DD5164